MKKLLLCVFLVIMSAGCALADVMPPYVVIEGAAEISGGNEAVYVSGNDGVLPDGSPVPDITIVSRLRSTLPVRRGNIPTNENSLLNPKDPVLITARAGSITLKEWGGDYVSSVRIFDAKGEPIEPETSGDKPAIRATEQPADYYLEFMQKDTVNLDAEDDPEFCYVLLRVKGGHDQAIISDAPRTSSIDRTGNPLDAIGELYRKFRREAESNPY